MIGISKQALDVTPNRLLTTPLPNLRRSKTALPSRPHSNMMLDYIAYLQAYTPKLRAPPQRHHAAKSAALNTTAYDSHLTKLLKEGLNRQRCASFGISRSLSCAPSCTRSKEPARPPVSARTASRIDTGSSQVILDDHGCLTSTDRPTVHNHLVEPVTVLQTGDEVTREAKDDEATLNVPVSDGCKQVFEDPHGCQNLDPVSLQEAPTNVFAEHDSDKRITNTLEKLPPNPPPDKHDRGLRQRAVAGDKTVSNRKACRRFYKEAIIDRDVGRVYRGYAQCTALRLHPFTPAQLNYEKLLSRPLTATKETIAKKLTLYQIDTKEIAPVTPLLTDRAHACSLH